MAEGKQGGGMFGGGAKPALQQGMSADLMATLTSLNTRIRILEEKFDNIRNKLQVTDENLLGDRKKTLDDIHVIHDQIDEGKKDFSDLKDKFKLMIKEIQGMASDEDLQTLKKYIQYWEPMNFVTHNEVKKIIRDELEKVGK